MPDTNPIIKVQFNDTSEFIAEFRAAPPNIERVLRITKRFTATDTGFTEVDVLATYLRKPCDRHGEGDTQIIELRRRCGSKWAHGDDQALQQADAALDILTDAAKGQGIEVRAGHYCILSPV